MIAPADDIDRIMAVMDVAFPPQFGEAWTRRQVSDALMFGRCHHHIVDSDGEPAAPGVSAAGFTLSRTGYEEEELLLIAVDPAARRRGLGRALLDDLASAAKSRCAKQLLLEMRKGNPAEELYRVFGFVPIGERRNYYRASDGTKIDAITFAKHLD